MCNKRFTEMQNEVIKELNLFYVTIIEEEERHPLEVTDNELADVVFPVLHKYGVNNPTQTMLEEQMTLYYSEQILNALFKEKA